MPLQLQVNGRHGTNGQTDERGTTRNAAYQRRPHIAQHYTGRSCTTVT